MRGDIMSATFGRHINKKRLEKDMSLRDLANLTGLDHSYIARLEKNGSVPSRETIKKLSLALDIPIDELMVIAGYVPETHELGGLGIDGYIKKHGFQKLAEVSKEYGHVVKEDNHQAETPFQDVPPDIARFAIDKKNQALIRMIQDMQAAGYSNEVINEWLEALKKTLIELGQRYGAQPGKAVWPGASPEQQEKLQEKLKDPSELRRKIESFRHKK